MSSGPNPTLYIKNLNDKVRKEELRRSLYLLFSQYGTVVDVVAVKDDKMRGQAFVVFDQVAQATDARKDLADKSFYGKPMKIFFAHERSFAIDPSQRQKRDARRAASAPVKKAL
eukprot:GILI01033386.1.p1 GENE.GILI01033386.1~~GILI01033386.1.p1  ORF type:complete len:124 (+),score=19.45 GILI01033386.1:33-374(+)